LLTSLEHLLLRDCDDFRKEGLVLLPNSQPNLSSIWIEWSQSARNTLIFWAICSRITSWYRCNLNLQSYSSLLKLLNLYSAKVIPPQLQDQNQPFQPHSFPNWLQPHYSFPTKTTLHSSPNYFQLPNLKRPIPAPLFILSTKAAIPTPIIHILTRADAVRCDISQPG
jgi:hypothetical protein